MAQSHRRALKASYVRPRCVLILDLELRVSPWFKAMCEHSGGKFVPAFLGWTVGKVAQVLVVESESMLRAAQTKVRKVSIQGDMAEHNWLLLQKSGCFMSKCENER